MGYEVDKFRLKNLFEQNGFEPETMGDAINFFNAYYGLNTIDCFVKKIVVNDDVVEVKVDTAYPFGAFIPQVWGQLTETERVNAINMVKNYFVKMDLLNKQKIQLSFIPPEKDCKADAGFMLGFKNVNSFLYVNEKFILASTDEEGMQLLGILIHELTHASQRMTQLNLNKYSIHTFNDFYKNTINSSDLNNKLKKSSMEDYVSINKNDFSQEEMEIIKQMLDDDKFKVIKHILYTTLTNEMAAENRAKRMYYQIAKDMYKKYGVITRTTYKELYKKFGERANQKFDFVIRDDDYEKFTKIGILFCCEETRSVAIKHLIDFYTNKQLTKKISDKLVKYAFDTLSRSYVESAYLYL